MAPISTPVLDPSLLSYLQSLGLGDQALASLLDQAAGGLLGAVPPAGQYITSLDFTTLEPALKAAYVGQVIHAAEAQLGPAPELYSAAVSAGYLSPEQASAMASTSQGTVGTLQQQYERQGGLRALAGPYQAERGKVLAQAQADMQTAAQKASTDAYTVASKTTDSRINALGQAGQVGTQLSGQGVSRRNAQDMAAAAGGGDQPGFQLPDPNANQPSLWEKILPGLITAMATGGLAWATRPHATTTEEKINAQQEQADATAQIKDYRANTPLGQAGVPIKYSADQGAYPDLTGTSGQRALDQSTASIVAMGSHPTNPYTGTQPPSPASAPAAPQYEWQNPVQAPQNQQNPYQNGQGASGGWYSDPTSNDGGNTYWSGGGGGTDNSNAWGQDYSQSFAQPDYSSPNVYYPSPDNYFSTDY